MVMIMMVVVMLTGSRQRIHLAARGSFLRHYGLSLGLWERNTA